jgi:hypothetical protein
MKMIMENMIQTTKIDKVHKRIYRRYKIYTNKNNIIEEYIEHIKDKTTYVHYCVHIISI